MLPPRAAGMRVDELGALDDEALGIFLDPVDGGVDPRLLGMALQGSSPSVARRALAALPAGARADASAAWSAAVDDTTRREAWAAVLETLFWPLLYWNHPDEYLELIDGETIEPALLQQLPLDGAVVCDIGAGAGRFTLHAARRATHVVAVDAVPALLAVLQRQLDALLISNVTVQRGAFTALPLPNASVDVAVACSSFMTSGPHGGARALREAERITRPGGVVAALWPQDPDWFVAHGYRCITVAGDAVRHFPSVERAIGVCDSFYGADASAYVRRHGSADVPYEVLHMPPPLSMCVRTLAVTPSR
jgi:SAM-dependent methyltransferase